MDIPHTTVMGPDCPSSAGNISSGDPPPPDSRRTSQNNVNYCYSVSIWEDITRNFASADKKSAANLNMMGIILYITCDDKAKEILGKAETRG